MRESSGRSASSNRPDSSCSSSVTSAWKRRPRLSTSTMSPAPMPFDVVRARCLRGLDVEQRRLRLGHARTLRGRPDGLPDARGAARRSPRGRCARRRSCVRSAASAPASARPEGLHVGRPLPAEAVQRGGVREVEPVRRGDVVDELLAPRAGDRQEVEDPAAVVVQQHDRQLRAASATRPAARRRRGPARRRRSAARPGRDAAAATPNAVETVPSMPFAPRLESTAERPRRAPGRTSRRRAPASRRRRRASRPSGSPAPSSAATRGSLSPAGPTTAAIAPAAARSARRQSSSQPRSAAAELRARRAPRAGRRRRSVPTDAGRVLPGGLRVERDLQRVRGAPATGAAAWRSAGRRRAARAPARGPPPTPRERSSAS